MAIFLLFILILFILEWWHKIKHEALHFSVRGLSPDWSRHMYWSYWYRVTDPCLHFLPTECLHWSHTLLSWCFTLPLSSGRTRINTLTWCQFLVLSPPHKMYFSVTKLWVTAAWFRFKLGPASGDSLSRVFILSQFKTGDKRKIMNNLNLPRKVIRWHDKLLLAPVSFSSILNLSFCCSRLSWHF